MIYEKGDRVQLNPYMRVEDYYHFKRRYPRKKLEVIRTSTRREKYPVLVAPVKDKKKLSEMAECELLPCDRDKL